MENDNTVVQSWTEHLLHEKKKHSAKKCKHFSFSDAMEICRYWSKFGAISSFVHDDHILIACYVCVLKYKLPMQRCHKTSYDPMTLALSDQRSDREWLLLLKYILYM
jgi:hypothetical protein